MIFAFFLLLGVSLGATYLSCLGEVVVVVVVVVYVNSEDVSRLQMFDVMVWRVPHTLTIMADFVYVQVIADDDAEIRVIILRSFSCLESKRGRHLLTTRDRHYSLLGREKESFHPNVLVLFCALALNQAYNEGECNNRQQGTVGV
jgi:hypothetical protein